MIELYEHQKEAVEAILKHKKFAIFYEVGTGKTIIGLEVIKRLNQPKTLIICPLTVLPEWEKNIKSYLGSDNNITVLNPEKVIRKKELENERFDIVIFDEAHKVKSKTAKISKMVKKITSKSEYSIALTGTPVANNLLDVYNIFDNMNIREFDEKYMQFLDRYFWYELKQVFGSSARYYHIHGVKPEMKDELKSRISKKSLVKRQQDCIKLPEKTFHLIKVSGMVNKIYKDLEKGNLTVGDMPDTMIALVKAQKLHQMSNGFLYGDNNSDIIYKDDKNNKIKIIKQLVEDVLENTNQVIIVYKFQEDLRQLQEIFKDYQTTLDRDEFEQLSIPILFRQIQKSEGVNLQFCNTMIYYSYDWSFINFDQMAGRIYRNGQVKNCTYYVLISEKTIEEDIWDAIVHKQSQDEFLKKIQNKKG